VTEPCFDPVFESVVPKNPAGVGDVAHAFEKIGCDLISEHAPVSRLPLFLRSSQ
jgi:hypothetical protein